MSDSKLRAVALAIGGDTAAEYVCLVGDQGRLRLIEKAMQGVSPAPAPSKSPKIKVAGGSTAKSPAVRDKRWEDLTERQQIDWLMKALETKAKANGSWDPEVWRKTLSSDFGRYSARLGRSIRSAIARTSGKRRALFVGRIKRVCGKDAKSYLDRLAKL